MKNHILSDESRQAFETQTAASGKDVKRTYQDSLFRMLFADEESAIELINALDGTNYGPDTQVIFQTLDDAIYVDEKNDLAFTIDNRFIVLTEHQFTKSNNMAIRQLQYIGRTYEKLLDARALYGTKAVKIPTPEFFVIYTGEEPWDNPIQRLSNHFDADPPENSMELVVKIFDLRYNTDNEEIKKILARSHKLSGYIKLLTYIRENQKTEPDLKQAVNNGIKRCIKENILKDFLETHSSEVGTMIFTAITREEFAEIRAQEAAKEAAQEFFGKGIEQGIEQGVNQGIQASLEIMRDLGLTAKQAKEKLLEKYPTMEAKIEELMKNY